jgi:protein transport protein SEC31
MVWDLRNARAPEKVLTGHEKGVLSLSWCKQDADLLLSCGKDNRTLCWNPQTSEVIGELPSADNWAFQVDWCPRNPDIFATAFFDQTIGIHSIQSTNESQAEPTPQREGISVFDDPNLARSNASTLSITQTPKWLRRPVSSSFGFGGKLITVSNLPSAQGKNQSSVVHVRSVVTEQDIVERAKKLQEAIGADDLKTLAESKRGEGEAWKALLSLFQANSRDELVTLLGFSKDDIAARVAEAVETLKASAEAKLAEEDEEDITEERSEPVVSFAEPERQEVPSDNSDAGEGNEISDAGSSKSLLGADGGESTTTVPSLFGEDEGPGTPQVGSDDFFSSLSATVPHTDYGLDASVAATIGSGPSSVSSEVIKNNIFKIYPTDESETDRLVTKALVLGDFESAVTLCLSSDRFADAILLAARGGPELLQKTQKAYFERKTTALPYLRLFQSIVTNDLADIVQNADLQEWQEIFVVLCTFASQEEFAGLAEQLGARLEFQFALAKRDSDGDDDAVDKAKPFRKNATLTYLAAGKLERLVSIWVDELIEEEKAYLENTEQEHGSYFSAHANALQTFVEKVATFRAATKYKDEDLNLTSSSNDAVKTFKLAALYDRYFEYADLLATQGLLKEAAEILKLTPAAYKGSSATVDRTAQRQRLVNATASSSKHAATPAASTSSAARGPYGGYTQASVAPAVPTVPSVPTYPSYQPPAVHTQPQQPSYAPSVHPSQSYQPSGYQPSNPYQPANVYNPPAPTQPAPPPPVGVPPPLRAGGFVGANGRSGTPSNQLPPPPLKRDPGGWNDAPAMKPAALKLNDKPQAITSPFPNAPSPSFSPAPSPYVNLGQQGGNHPLPPPPRPGSVSQNRAVPPPPRVGSVQAQGMRPPSVPPGHAPRLPTPSQYAPPPQAQGGHPPPPGPYSRPGAQPPQFPHGTAPPPPQLHPAPSGPYAPPQGHQQQPPSGPYAPPQGSQQQHPAPPPQVTGPYTPPQGGQSQQGPPPPPSARGPGGPPPPPGGPSGGPAPSRAPPTVRSGPPPPKYREYSAERLDCDRFADNVSCP